MNAAELFASRDAALEYRPVKQGDGVLWYWVLLPLPGEEAAIATGQGASKGMASVAARQFAHKLRKRITKVRTYGLAESITESGEPAGEGQADMETRRALKRLFKPGTRWKRINFKFPTTTFDPATLKRAVLAQPGQQIEVVVNRVLVDGIEFGLPDGQHSHLAWPDKNIIQPRFVGGGLELSVLTRPEEPPPCRRCGFPEASETGSAPWLSRSICRGATRPAGTALCRRSWR